MTQNAMNSGYEGCRCEFERARAIYRREFDQQNVVLAVNIIFLFDFKSQRKIKQNSNKLLHFEK